MTIKLLPLLLGLLCCNVAGFSKSMDLPSAFTENKGQITDQQGKSRSDIDFKLAAAPGLSIFIGRGSIHYQWSQAVSILADPAAASSDIRMCRMDVTLIGANANPRLSMEDPMPGWERYYTVGTGTAGAVTRRFWKATYHDVYPGIDWVFYLNGDGRLEHDFILRPGSRLSDIRLCYEGCSELELLAGGGLAARTPMGSISEAAPFAYEKDTRRKVSSAYLLQGNVLAFTSGPYGGTLVVDPVVEWGTYFGGTDYEDISKMAQGKYGGLYIAGSTASAGNIATTGAFQQTFGGGSGLMGADAFIAKFSEDGSCLWSTYYGGSGIDLGKAVACDTNGNIYLSGRTNSSTSIATTGSYQQTKAGSAASYDGFLVKLDTAGQRIWGTYFGGPGQEGTHQITVACDGQSGIYLSGNTASTSGIATPGAFQSSLGGGQDAFLARFDTAGSLDWATYFGGSGLDVGYSIATDGIGNALLAGYSASSGLATSGAYQSVNGGGEDVLLAKFNALGQLQWCSYLGGTEQDRAFSVSTDSQGGFYIAGLTLSPSGISSPGSFQPALGDPAGDGMLARFSNDGQLLWSTYYGGSQSDILYGISNIHVGTLYVTGTSYSDSGIATPEGLDTALTGAYNAYIGKFDTSGNRLWGSYFGNLFDEGTAALVTPEGKVLIGGKTFSSTGIGTPGAHQPTSGGDQDGFIVAINDCQLPGGTDTIFGDQTVCAGDTITYSAGASIGAESYVWLLPAGWSGPAGSDTIRVVIGNVTGTIRVTALNQCGGSGDTAQLTVTVNPLPEPVITQSDHILSTTQPFPAYQWNLNGLPITGATGPTHIAGENGSYTVTVSNTVGCRGVSAPITISDITTVTDLERRYNIKVFPNPVRDIVYVDLPMTATIVLTDAIGSSKLKLESKSGTVSLPLKDLPAGVYSLSFYDNIKGYLGTFRLVKQ